MANVWSEPWLAVERGGHVQIVIRIGRPENPSEKVVATVVSPGDLEERGVVADLIAAAPELRRTLRELLAYIHEVCPAEVLDADVTLRELCDEARGALASAGTAGLPQAEALP